MSDGVIHGYPHDNEHIDRHAYNAAFYELGLRWHWDTDTYRALQKSACEKERIRIYVNAHHAHLLTVYDADFLAEAIHSVKARHRETMMKNGASWHADVDWMAMHADERGI